MLFPDAEAKRKRSSEDNLREGADEKKSQADRSYSYFGKVGMRHFHLLRNHYWKPTINLDKVRSLDEI